LSKKRLATIIAICAAIIIVVVVVITRLSPTLPPEPTFHGLQFDGVDDYVNVGTLGNFGSTISGGNISFDIKTTYTESRQDVLGSVNNGSATAFGVQLNYIQADDIAFVIRDDDGKRLWGVVNSTGLTDGEWHAVGIHYQCSTNTIEISIDEVSRAVNYTDQQTPSRFSNFQYDIALGATNNRGTVQLYFEGVLTDITIDNGGLGGHWKFDEGSGSTAYDTSGNNNHGTLHGDPVWLTGGE
jgi:hypothetical protein